MKAGVFPAVAWPRADPFSTAGVNYAAKALAESVKVDHFAPPRLFAGRVTNPMIEIMARTP